ncbi:MAG TPA: type II secretion system F family protein [Vicinamibacterales bacterium]|jgi:tight adherence protein C|nr:type II secretion system F family protein [Vicinamibacterales bacterium]
MLPDLSLLYLAVFASVALAAWAIGSMVSDWGSVEQRQIRKISQTRGEAIASLQLTDTQAAWVKRFQQVVPKSPKEMSALQRRLATAGYRDTGTAVLYGLAETGLPIVCGIAAFVQFGVTRWYLVVFAAVMGFVAPSLWLSRKTALRQKQIRNGLPDALDLMIVCIESGSSVDQSIVKASDELDISHPALADELRLVTMEMRAGKARLEAFKNFASRTKVDEVRSLVAMLIQTDRFGTSIAQALRTHAEVARTKRRQNAEERAAKIGVKLVFPLVFFLFPALYIAILGPVVVDYVTEFKPGIVNR